MDCTDRHERYFLRLITRRALLYTEMVTAQAILHGDLRRLLGFNVEEHPVALQLGGSDPGRLAAAARIGADFGYDEINLNVGCPSDRVLSGQFGVSLMAKPELVADCVDAMRGAVAIPVTVKTRIGFDDNDDYSVLQKFVKTVASAGCRTFAIHARKAWLQGLSPKENREVPPLCYDRVYQLKEEFENLEIVINGGILALEEVEDHLRHVDGTMIGREAYQHPYLLADVDRRFYGEGPGPSRDEVLERFCRYVDSQIERGVRLHQMTRHIGGLFAGMPGARAWRRHLSENGVKPGADARVVREAVRLKGAPA
jgi:tRNA-dihydrouridine synthase A